MNLAKRSHLFIYATLIACVLISASLYLFRQPHANQPSINGLFLPIPIDIAPFDLQDTKGHAFTLESLKQHWSFIFVGFATCPDVCPTTLGVFDRVFAHLQKAHGVVMPQFIFVSVDPERDTLPKLAEYVHKFNDDFIGATGKNEELKKLANSLNVFYEKIYNADKTMYVFNHSTSVALVNPDGKLQAVFTSPLQADDIANNYIEIVDYVDKYPTQH